MINRNSSHPRARSVDAIPAVLENTGDAIHEGQPVFCLGLKHHGCEQRTAYAISAPDARFLHETLLLFLAEAEKHAATNHGL